MTAHTHEHEHHAEATSREGYDPAYHAALIEMRYYSNLYETDYACNSEWASIDAKWFNEHLLMRINCLMRVGQIIEHTETELRSEFDAAYAITKQYLLDILTNELAARYCDQLIQATQCDQAHRGDAGFWAVNALRVKQDSHRSACETAQSRYDAHLRELERHTHLLLDQVVRPTGQWAAPLDSDLARAIDNALLITTEIIAS